MRFLRVWLRVMQNMTTEMIAKTVGWHVNTVRFTQIDFIKRGIPALTESKRGGRYHSLMSEEEEAAFLSQFEEAGGNGSILTANDIKEKLERRLGRSVHLATVYRILHRRGWRKVVPGIPRGTMRLRRPLKKGLLGTAGRQPRNSRQAAARHVPGRSPLREDKRPERLLGP
jgi:transposase